MSILARQVSSYLDRASWIRKMFEQGAVLKARYGEDAVCDFSLGNPDLPPPAAVRAGLLELAEQAGRPYAFGYMPNTGYPAAREALAVRLAQEQGVPVQPGDLIVTCGAAGGLNALFRAVLDPGDEVLGFAPFFVEYGFYVENHGARFVPVPTRPLTFALDLAALEAAITAKTRIVLVNSPNNPTGQVYPLDELTALAQLLTRKSDEYGRPIFLVSDEPYRFLTYDGCQVPAMLPLYPYCVVVSSFSKNLSLAGERVGYVVAAPDMPDKGELLAALALTNRILGYVNAPSIGQLLAIRAIHEQVDVAVYAARRTAMAGILQDAGYVFTMPRGAFYFFPQAPGGDDVAFVHRLLAEHILAVPGSGFGCPGYFRLAFCCDEAVIRRAAPGFARAIAG